MMTGRTNNTGGKGKLLQVKQACTEQCQPAASSATTSRGVGKLRPA